MKIPSLTALTCQEVVEIVADYLAGELSAPDTARLEQHFHACTWCGVYVDQLRLTSQTLARLENLAQQDAAADSSRERLLAHFRRMKESP